MFGDKKDDREISGPTLSATDEPVAEIRIVGNRTIPREQVLNQLQTRVGRPFDPALVQRDVRKLMQRGWFVDVQPTYDQTDAGRIVTFTVTERRVIRYVDYLGNEGIRDKKLNKETGLKLGGPLDPYAVDEARRKIVELYHRNGYNHVQVTVLEGDEPTHNGAVFVINEGTAQKIWKVEMVGNKFLSARRLKTIVESKPPMMMVFKGFVDREQIEADVDRLTAYYRSFGFFQAKVGRQLVFNDKNTWLTLRFVIHEGPRYDVESVAFIGNKIFASDSLGTGIEMPSGKPFEQAKMNADVEWLKELYGSQGYVFADIRAEPIFLEEPGKLRLMYHIEEGRRWRIGNIYVHIKGENPHTKIRTALNRLSFTPGQIVDIREIRASERRLQASGLYMTNPALGEMPKITYQIQDLNDIELASEEGGPGFRGQSPDAVGSPSRGGQSAARLPAPVAVGPPLVAPPGAAAQHRAAVPRTFKAPAPAGFAEGDDQVDVHLYVDDSDNLEFAEPPAPLSPTAQVHEVRRPPFVDNGAPAYRPYHYATNSHRQVAAGSPQPADARPYQHLTIRTQSPYQASTTGQPAAPAHGTGNYPVSQAYHQQGYPTAAPAYGQAVGATGPDAAPVGTTPYAVRQAAITEPPLPPRQPTSPAPVVVGQPVAPPFGPPPIGPPPATAYPGPQATTAPQYGPPVVYGPSGTLPPDPNIIPIAPIPTNPQLFPNAPTDSFTPMLDPLVDINVVASEAQTGRLMLGVAVNSDAGLVGQILLDEQNFDWTRFPRSWDDFASGRAWRGDGQRFRIEAAPGTEVHRYLVSFQEPYLWGTPVSLGLSGSFFDRRYRDWDEQRLGGRVGIGYQWTANDLSANIAYRGESIHIGNVSDPNLEELREVRGSNSLHGFRLAIANDTRDSAFLATQGHYLELSVEQVVGTFNYPRAIVDGRKYFLLRERPDHSGRHVLTLSSRVGFTGDDTPIYENFFAGGYSTLRGFDFRGASPVKDGVQVGGEFMWVNTVEYLFPLTADDMMHGVTFVDFGTVEPKVALNEFRVAPGFGLRITVPAMGPAPIALDFAFPIAKADFDDTQVFSFNIGLQR